MRTAIIIIVMLSAQSLLFSQKEANNWIYGTRLGKTFNNPDTILQNIPTVLWAEDASASVSDSKGKLLFYTNGDVVFNSKGDTISVINDTLKAMMSRGLKSNNIVNGSTLAIPKPGSDAKYYIFHIVGDLNRPSVNKSLYYSTIDMNANKGNGELWDSRKLINKKVRPYWMAATKQKNGKDYWLAFMDDKDRAIFFYKINSKGIYLAYLEYGFTNEFKPVLRNGQITDGQMKFSALGDKLALSTPSCILVLNFDNETAITSNPVLIYPKFEPWENKNDNKKNNLVNCTGLEFSPDSKKLYAFGRQWDLSLNSDSAVNSSQYRFYDSASFYKRINNDTSNLIRKSILYNYQLAPDGRIYMPWMDSLEAINDPNEKGALCNFKPYGVVYVSGIGPGWVEQSQGLPGFISSYMKFEVKASFDSNSFDKEFKSIELCESDDLRFYANELKDAKYSWSGPGGFTSNDNDPYIPYLNRDMTGWFVVKAVRRHDEISYDSIYVKVNPSPATFIEPSGNIKKCQYTTIQLEATPDIPGNKYLWSTGSSTKSVSVSDEGVYYLYVADSSGCTRRDSVIVSFTKLYPELEMIGDPFSCEGDTVIVRTKLKYDKYHWTNGDSTWEARLTKTTRCSVEVVDINGCAGWTDAVEVKFYGAPKTYLKGPKTVCLGSEIVYSVSNVYKDTIYWEINGGKIISGHGTDTIHVLFDKAGKAFLEVKQAAYSGCLGKAGFEITIVDDLKPKILPENPAICSDNEIVLSTLEEYDKYEWSAGGVILSNSPTFTVNSEGTYYLTVTVQGGCKGSDSIIVKKGKYPEPMINGINKLCPGQFATLNVSSKTGSTANYEKYLWNTGDTTQSINVNTAGNYFVEVTDSNGCKGFASVDVNEIKIEVSGINDVDFGRINIDNNDSKSMVIKNKSSEKITIENIQLKNNIGQYTIVTLPKIPVSLDSGSIINIKIDFKPDYMQLYSDSLIIEVREPCPETYSSLISGAGVSKLTVWLPSVNTQVNSELCIPIKGKLETQTDINLDSKFNAEIIYDASSFYNVDQTVININEASLKLNNLDLKPGRDTTTIFDICGIALLPLNTVSELVFKSFDLTNPYCEVETKSGILSINGCSIKISHIINTELLDIELVPNPAEDEITIKYRSSNNGIMQIKVYNPLGLEVENFQWNKQEISGEFICDVSNLTNGIYFYQVVENDGIVARGRFIVNK